jgi:predicted KAP-like P-loop ATPase
MNLIKKELDELHDESIITVWFDAWRYEREEHFAIIPLLKTISYSIPEEKHKKIKKAFKEILIGITKSTPLIIPYLLSGHIDKESKNVLQEILSQIKNELSLKEKLINEVDRKTIYYDGIDLIKKSIKNSENSKPSVKIVVFIDDLDRCSPNKALEILESIKVFLDIDGFIYIIGLSHKKMSQLITTYYKEGSGIDGKEYIKKIIQIPITISEWNIQDIHDLIDEFISKGLIHADYQTDIKENKDLVSKAVEQNPREIKRFLNNFIVAFETFSNNSKIKSNELLLIQALQIRWNDFYNFLLTSEKNTIDEIKKYIRMTEFERLKELEITSNDEERFIPTVGNLKTETNYDKNKVKQLLQNFKSDLKLWEFLNTHFDILNGIKDLSIYRRVTKISNDLVIDFGYDNERKIIEEEIKKLQDEYFDEMKLENFDEEPSKLSYFRKKRIQELLENITSLKYRLAKLKNK